MLPLLNEHAIVWFSAFENMVMQFQTTLAVIVTLGCSNIGLAAPPIVIAHRGDSGYLCEHTPAAKALAHGMRADYLEQDVALTKDDVPIVLHDVHLDTVADVPEVFPERKRDVGRYLAIDFTHAEIKRLRRLFFTDAKVDGFSTDVPDHARHSRLKENAGA